MKEISRRKNWKVEGVVERAPIEIVTDGDHYRIDYQLYKRGVVEGGFKSSQSLETAKSDEKYLWHFDSNSNAFVYQSERLSHSVYNSLQRDSLLALAGLIIPIAFVLACFYGPQFSDIGGAFLLSLLVSVASQFTPMGRKFMEERKRAAMCNYYNNNPGEANYLNMIHLSDRYLVQGTVEKGNNVRKITRILNNLLEHGQRDAYNEFLEFIIKNQNKPEVIIELVKRVDEKALMKRLYAQQTPTLFALSGIEGESIGRGKLLGTNFGDSGESMLINGSNASGGLKQLPKISSEGEEKTNDNNSDVNIDFLTSLDPRLNIIEQLELMDHGEAQKRDLKKCYQILSDSARMISEASNYSTHDTQEREKEKFSELVSLCLPVFQAVIRDSEEERMKQLIIAEKYLRDSFPSGSKLEEDNYLANGGEDS